MFVEKLKLFTQGKLSNRNAPHNYKLVFKRHCFFRRREGLVVHDMGYNYLQTQLSVSTDF